MRLVMVMVLAGLMASPLSVSAQAGEELPSEEPALQLQVDDAGVEVVPSPPRTVDGYTLEEMELRVKRAKIGLGVSAGVLFVGGAVFVVRGLYELTHWDTGEWGVWTGTALLAGGFVGMITSSVLLRRRKRDRDSLRQAHYGTPRRVQWDLARSRFVF